jgi:hypothetical protein
MFTLADLIPTQHMPTPMHLIAAAVC